MKTETRTLKAPSAASVELVLRSAYNAPQANCEAAQRTMSAIREMEAFFSAILQPTKSQAAESSESPQASASAAGS